MKSRSNFHLPTFPHLRGKGGYILLGDFRALSRGDLEVYRPQMSIAAARRPGR